MNVRVDRDSCIGCGLCPTIDPDVFAMDDENLAYVGAQPDMNDEPATVEAAESCPVDAIQIL